jgi:F-type H+-transporting ATPase subunit b
MRRRMSWLVLLSAFVLIATARTLVAQEHKAEASGGGHSAAEGGHEAEGEINVLHFDPNLAFFTLITFAILLFILSKYAWKPLIKAMEDREHGYQKIFDEAERARTEAAALLEEHRNQLARAHEQIRGLIDEARRDAESTKDDIITKAKSEADATVQRAKREIGTAKDEALLEIWSKSADLAVSVAEKVLSREIGPDEHRRLIELATQQVQAHPVGNGRKGG